MKDKLNLVEDLKLTSYNPSTISADFLANFMSKREYLEAIIKNMAFIPRYYSEHVNYLELKYNDIEINKFIIPMVCFCDIKLHQISYHAEGKDGENGYGKFAMVLNKEWGVRKGVQPVQYVTKNSIFQCQLSRSFNLYIKAVENEETTDLLDDIADILLEQVRFIKPLSGEMPKRDELIRNKNFTDEKEWRFVPDVPDDIARNLLIDPIDEIEISSKGIESMNGGIKLIKAAHLNFQVSDIKYLFVESEEDAEKLTAFILSLRGNKLPKKEKLSLIRKISVYDVMKGDF